MSLLLCNGKLSTDFTESLSNIVSNVKSIQDENELSEQFTDSIKTLRAEYQDEDFYEALDKFLNNRVNKRIRKQNPVLDRVLSSFNSSMIESQKEDSNILNSISEGDSKYNMLDETVQEKIERENQKESFLNKYFPLSSDARLSFEQRFKNDIIQSLFINKTGNIWTLNVSSSDMDKSIKHYQEDLLNDVEQYLTNFYPGILDAYKANLTIGTKISFLKKLFDQKVLSPLPRIDLIKIPNLENSNQKDKLKGYVSLIALINFDELIKSTFGDALSVGYSKDYSTDVLKNKQKYTLNLGNKSAKTFKDDKKDIDETGEIGSIIQLYIESLNVWKGDNIIPQKLTFSDIKTSFGEIMNLLSNSKISLSRINYQGLDQQKISDLKQIYGEVGFNNIMNNYPTIGSLLAKAKINPVMFAPILFSVLDQNSKTYFTGRPQIQDTIHSIYKNIYDYSNQNSLLSIALNSKSDNMTSDLYGFFSTLFVNIENTPFSEYKENIDGSKGVINITQNTSNKRLNNQVYSWEGVYNITIPQNFKTVTIGEFQKNEQGTYIPKLEILINGTDFKLIIENGTNVRLVSSSESTQNTQIGTYSNVNLEELTPELYNFLSEIFGFKVDNNFIDIFKSIRGDQQIKELFDVAGIILYNYKVGKTINAKTQFQYQNVIKNFYGKEVKPCRGSLQPVLIPNSEYPKVLAISQSRDIQLGYTSENTARDGENKQLAIRGLSALMSKYMELSYNHNFEPDSIVKYNDFAIYQLFNGVEFVRDYNGISDKRQSIKFSSNEFFSGSFIYDLYDGISQEVESDSKTSYKEITGDYKKVNETFIRIFGPTISDKSKLPKILVKPLDTVNVPGIGIKYIKDLTADDIRKIQTVEFGNYYAKMHNNILREFDKINQIISEVITPLIPTDLSEEESLLLTIPSLDYNSDFREFNDYIDLLNQARKQRGLNTLTSFGVLHNAVALLQRKALENGQSDYAIKMIDGVSYIKDRKGFLHNNPSLFHQLSIYGRPVQNFEIDSNLKFSKESLLETPEQERLRHKYQLLQEFFKDDVTVKLDKSIDKANAIAYKRNNDVGFMQGSMVILGKIKLGNENTQSLVSKKDFEKWNQYQRLVELFGNELPDDLKISNPTFRIDKVLGIINNVRRLRSLTTKEATEVLLSNNKFKKRLLSYFSGISVQEIIEADLAKKNPTWHDDTIVRKAQEFINSKSKKELSDYIAKLAINDIVENSIITNSDNILVSEMFDLVQDLDIVKERLSSQYSIELNPEIEKHNALNQWLGESYNLTSVGSFIAHPGNPDVNSIFNYEESQYGQQVKRQVSQTASKHREMQNSLYGIGEKLKFFVVEDERDSVITYSGLYKKGGTKPYDGATFYNMFMNVLDNNSLGADAMGTDKKPFTHAFDSQTGIGLIIKTAGFILNNQRIRESQSPGSDGRDAKMNRRMNDTIKWTQVLRQNGIQSSFYNYLQKYDGTKIQMNPWYVYYPETKQWVQRSNLRIDENGITRWDEVNVTSTGEIINNTQRIGGDSIIDSNYQLWKVFGGEWSGHLQNGKLSYENDDSSTLNVLQIMNNAGIVNNSSAFKDSKIKTQENVIQVLKQSMMNFTVTMGASKFGAVNINSTEFYDDDNYEATWMECNSSDFGEQLDAEHDSEGGHVSLMTQVVNALSARGYSRQDAQECYEALEAVVLQSFEEGFDGLLHQQEGNSEPLKIFIYNLLKKSLNNVSIEDGNIMSALAQGLKELDLNNLEDFEGNFAISDPRIFNILQSKIASSIEKSVRLKIDGGQMVLNPSNRRKQLIGDYLSSKVTHEDVVKMQQKSDMTPLSASALKFGRSYYIMDNLRNKIQLVFVDDYPDMKILYNALKTGFRVVEAFIDPDEKEIKRDLATYDCTLTSVDGREYSLWQVDVVRQLRYLNNNKFDEPETIQEELWNKWQRGEILSPFEEGVLNDWLISLKVPYTTNDEGLLVPNKNINLEKYLRHSLQKTLDALGNGTASTVQVDGETIIIDKSKTKVSPYEAILPMMYKTEFGLEEGDQVNEIVNDKFFFVKRDAQKIASKLSPTQFDLELKVGNGNHIYLHYSKGRELQRGVVQVDIETVTENGVTYRSENGKKLYPISPNTKIFKNIRNGTEIISTDDLTLFLNYFKYNNIQFGNVREEDFGTILSQINDSEDEVAQNLIERIVEITRNRTKNHKEGLLSGQGDDTLKILVDKGLDQKLLQIENPETLTINDIIENDVLVNEAIHSNLVVNGQKNYQEGIEKLLKVISNEKLDNKQQLIENLQVTYPFIKTIISKGFNKHTSFLSSLDSVVSRTPAQSHQSFMTMRVVGFDQGRTNSIYVNRMQLFLQGSDYDIDKANVLGLKFHNGELITWSCFYDLSSRESSDISEKFPFPTGKRIGSGNMISRAFDINEKNYDTLIQNDNQIIVRDDKGNVLSAIKVQSEKGYYWAISGDNSYTTIRAILHKIPQGDQVYYRNPLNNTLEEINNEGLGIKNNINTKEYNYEEDFDQYLKSLEHDNNGKYTLSALVDLIRTANGLIYISPKFENEIKLIDKHNTYLNGKNKSFRRKYALYNFISIKAKNISKNPINLIQGQSGIDEATDEFKDAVNPNKKIQRELEGKSTFDRLAALPITSDSNTIMARIRSLILTLSGKQNTGIVASAMKTFEAMSQYYYNILAIGSAEQQLSLLSDIKINGKSFELLANSYVKNEDSIKNESVKKALQNVDNLEDAFILMSALLSLSTDNAKDPTLSKYNAGPEMIGTYVAGIIMGVDMDTLRDLMISDTGILLSNLQKGNVFDPDSKKFNRLSQAINFLLLPPNLGKQPSDLYIDLVKVFDFFGIPHSDSNKIQQEDLQKALISKRLRRKMRSLAGFLLHPDRKRTPKSDEQLIKQAIKDIKEDPSYWLFKEGGKKRLELEKLSKIENPTKRQKEKLDNLKAQEQEYNKLKTLLEEYQKLSNGEQSKTAQDDLTELKELQDSLSSNEYVSKLKDYLFDKRGNSTPFRDYLQSIFDWTDYREIVENDIVTEDSKYSKDGNRHVRLYEIRKLNLVNEEMGELRKVLALNQGLPNLTQDQLNWINGFRSILRNSVKRKGLSDDDEALAPLIALNQQLRKDGKIFFEDDLFIDLNQFLINPDYQNAVIKAYDAAKQFVNIMDVMLNVPHYRGYLKAMNLLYEGSKTASVVYREQTRLSDWILPKLNIKEPSKLEQFQKTANSLIFRKINNEFLISQQEIYSIPMFSIVDGELKEEFDENGQLKYRTIKLGNESDNKIFADYVVNYLFPYLKKNYPENAFVKAITLRTYKFNPDHNLTVNVAKSQSYNMKNPQENVAFNEIKQGLQELNSVKLKDGNSAGIVTALFYYNLIAYNGQPGAQALTDLFEDLVVYDQNTHITDYANFLREKDKSDKPIFTEQDEDTLMRLLAPVVSGFENVYQYPYAYLINPETNKYELVKPKEKNKTSEYEDENDQYEIEQDIIAQEMLEAEYDDSEDFGGSSRKNISWSDLKKELGVENASQIKDISSDNNIIFRGYEINSDIYGLINNQSEDIPRNPLDVISEHANSIILTINGQQKTLQQFIEDANKLGWSKQECLEIFQFKQKKRSDGTKYSQLDLDILRHGLKSKSNQKPEC